MATEPPATLQEAEPRWMTSLPEKQRDAVARMMPALEDLARASDEVTVGKLVTRMLEDRFAARKQPSREAGHALAVLRGRVAREEIKQHEGGSLSAAEAAEKLGISKTAVLKRYRDGRLLGWREARQGSVRFPVWQFTEDNVLPGIADTLAILNQAPWMDDWGRISFFVQRRSSLKDQSPLDLLRKGLDERVTWAATSEVA